MHRSLALTLSASLQAALVASHAIMIKPPPYNLDSDPLYQTWTLSADLPFPCQGRTQHAEQVSNITAGTKEPIDFWTAFVHGGGSCQFSISYEDPASEAAKSPSSWRTIYSIVGGCPADAAGNLEVERKDAHQREDGRHCGDDTSKECVRSFNIPIPKGMKNGRATLAWTWINMHGNNEFYMSCSPVNVVGGEEDEEFISSLPPVTVVNTPGECTTGPSGRIFNYANPGKFGRVYKMPTEGGNGNCEDPGLTPPTFEDDDGSYLMGGNGSVGAAVVPSFSSSSSSPSSIQEPPYGGVVPSSLSLVATPSFKTAQSTASDVMSYNVRARQVGPSSSPSTPAIAQPSGGGGGGGGITPEPFLSGDGSGTPPVGGGSSNGGGSSLTSSSMTFSASPFPTTTVSPGTGIIPGNGAGGTAPVTHSTHTTSIGGAAPTFSSSLPTNSAPGGGGGPLSSSSSTATTTTTSIINPGPGNGSGAGGGAAPTPPPVPSQVPPAPGQGQGGHSQGPRPSGGGGRPGWGWGQHGHP